MKTANLFFEQAKRTIEDRGVDYGSPRKSFEGVAKRWSMTLGVKVTPEQVVMCMIELKLERLSDNPTHADSILDIAGYAAILHDIAKENDKGVKR